MRKILFRGKTIESAGMRSAGEWAYGGYFMDDCYGGCPEGKHYIVEWNSTGLGYFAHTQVDRETVGQFTGLQDKNGKRIFEGDIVQTYSGDKGEIIFKNGMFQRKINKEWGQDLTYPVLIIGNIYENPELLEQNTQSRSSQSHECTS